MYFATVVVSMFASIMLLLFAPILHVFGISFPSIVHLCCIEFTFLFCGYFACTVHVLSMLFLHAFCKTESLEVYYMGGAFPR